MSTHHVLALILVVTTSTCRAAYADFDYGGMPVQINRLLGEPSVLTLRGRVDSSWYRVLNRQGCPLECDCPIQWPSAMFCDNRGLFYVPTSLSPKSQYLFLQGNSIAALPRRMFENTTLVRWLILDHNVLTSSQIDNASLKGLHHLENLFMNYNNLTEIPSPLPSGLKQLRLAYNRINKIGPGVLDNLKNLTLLLLHRNQLKVIGEADFKGLQSLILLDLSHNSLTEFPAYLPPSIQQLYLSNNSLTALPGNCLINFKNLQYLRLSHNKLTNDGLPSTVFNTSVIVEMDLSYNHLTSIPMVHESLQYLFLEANIIEAFNTSSFCRKVGPVSFSKMKLLRLDGNRLSYSQLPSDWVLCLRVLRDIYI
uniref:Zgc:113307 n=1 Tax=Erpetoichthys calabaricus TaxID=27687 RepID=A0A8C4RRE9_ERPCA